MEKKIRRLQYKNSDAGSDCFGKIVFKTKARAEANARWLKLKGKWGGKKYPYYCTRCHAWHLTSEKPNKRVKYGNRYSKKHY